MKSYAGIGSRTISDEEFEIIKNISKDLSDKGFICYSGNADGSDIAFQLGSKGNCVIFLPWDGFNFNHFNPNNLPCKNHFIVGSNKEGQDSISKYHPNPNALSVGARKLMARNYYQVRGYKEHPKVDFVLCCADEDKNGNVLGGTGQAVRIAKSLNIPVVNIRGENWKIELINILL